MDQKFIQAKSLQEKLNLIWSQDRRLAPLELENLYKSIHAETQHGFQILDKALDRNFGGLLPDKASYSMDYNEGVFKRITESLDNLEMVGLYAKYVIQNCRVESHRPLLKQLGYVAERLIRKFRQQGTIEEKLQLNKEIVIDLVSRLCPKDMTYNPELLQLILKAYKDYKDDELLKRLADSLIQQCKDNANQNSDHDWLMLISTIFDQAIEQQGICLYILFKKIGSTKLGHIISQHRNYFLINYFDNPDKSVKIFKGLIKYSILSENLSILQEVTDILEEQMKQNSNQSCYLILSEIYLEVILPLLLPQLHQNTSILDLLQVYMIGMSRRQEQLTDDYITIMCDRLRLVIDLRQNDRSIFDKIYGFMNAIHKKYQNKLLHHDSFSKLLHIARDKSFDQFNQIDHPVWDCQKLKNLNFDDSLYDRPNHDNYVGLENLTNTCFMNSILQALYMTDRFRQFILINSIPEAKQYNALRKLFMLLNFQQSGFCSPYELKRLLRAPYCNSNDQQDVGEFAHHFLEDLLKYIPKEQQEILERIFFGTHRSVIECPNCDVSFGQIEKFLGIDLHLNKYTELKDMIAQVYEEEKIEFTCEKCQRKSNDIKKSIQLNDLPPVLFMTIQRFQYDAQSQQMTKILAKVPLRFLIDMREVFQQQHLDAMDSQYILYAFIVHLGKNSYSGHYSCYARSMSKPETWICFDDAQINKYELSSEDLNSQLIDEETPYLLFYKNKSGHYLSINK
ncbi:unnamed protein product (macronuclear) [Paramecium tetraurelia]|uniref:USP domain-containing protein n=1 Tax=Paramecium tetraurelia TaxID=5888 RepID=A0BWQ3_PARTE|nr:uncharacterized protein GSPATT00032822001 [Paramecium tetraurelia]CAK62970.1 unnamed protein product [Paramecium tetraurelia]|eukprot:XP_001430368.1 hypothetical protein (macronuclear) [Paramecium tetraurelia strain d4-2]